MLLSCFLRLSVANHEVDSDVEHVISGVSAAACCFIHTDGLTPHLDHEH